MWKDSVELKVIRLEGFPCSSTELACYLYYNDALHDQLIPITEEKSLVISEEGTYRLEINNQNNQEERTVSFEMALFAEDGVRWLPLFSQSNDFISEIPEEVSLPRILVIFYKKRLLGGTEYKTSPEKPPAESKATVSVYELNDEPLLSSIVPDEKVLQDYKVAIEFERTLRDEQEKNMARLSQELRDSLERSQTREDSLLQLVTIKEEELLAAQTEITTLRSRIRRLDIEKTQISDMFESVKAEKECLNIGALYKELEMFSHYFKDCEEIGKIKAKLEGYENKELGASEQEGMIFEAVKGKNVEVKKENDTVYSIGQKRVAITSKEGVLLFRTLGNLQRFEEMFQSSHERSMTPSTKFHRRVGSDARIMEHETKEGMSKKMNTSFNNVRKK